MSVVTAVGCASATGLRAGTRAAVTCVSRSVPVGLGGYTGARVTGPLCRGSVSRTLQILVPGATYGARYWRFPYQAQRYSYADAAVAAGYAVLVINRPGTAPSTGYPPASVLTIPSEAAALHQVITAARSLGFDRIIVAGHSLGSWVALDEEATFHDASALILTGAPHRSNPAGVARARAQAFLWPAARDPRLARDRIPAGCFTTRPGARAAVFCGDCTTAADREDEMLKTTRTVAEISGISPALAQSPTLSRSVPAFSCTCSPSGNARCLVGEGEHGNSDRGCGVNR